MRKTTHWTQRSNEDFLYSIASDFIEALKKKMQTLGMSQSKLAKKAKVNKSYVSRTFKDPGNLTLETIVKFARTVGMKVSVLAYEDKSDPNNNAGPIDSEVFRLCWENAGQPADMWASKQKTIAQTSPLLADQLLADLRWSQFAYDQRSNNARPNLTGDLVTLPYDEIVSRKNTGAEWDIAKGLTFWEV